jgi:hypothetical protein
MMYVQYLCIQDESVLNNKRRDALVVIALGIFISLLFLLSLYYQEKTAILDYKLWDVNTVTAADFTVETFISQPQW